MNLNWFREFLVLASTCNYLEAADMLYIGQSNLSKHIKSMEAELGGLEMRGAFARNPGMSAGTEE